MATRFSGQAGGQAFAPEFVGSPGLALARRQDLISRSDDLQSLCRVCYNAKANRFDGAFDRPRK
jgi:hypothetical protein